MDGGGGLTLPNLFATLKLAGCCCFVLVSLDSSNKLFTFVFLFAETIEAIALPIPTAFFIFCAASSALKCPIGKSASNCLCCSELVRCGYSLEFFLN